MKASSWENVPYLDVLRPEPGWQVEHAVISTYSLDLVAAVAAMLALAGLDDETGSGSRVDFAKAHERLKGRFRIIAQAGRVALPAKTPPILAIVDQFIREAAADERSWSWHAKAALVKHCPEGGGASAWRLWLGSRNLTRDIAWDSGLVLLGAPGADGKAIPGIDQLAEELYRRADLPGVSHKGVAAEVSELRWHVPEGCEIQEVRLLLPDSAERRFPAAPEGIKQLLVVSPFLDGEAISQFGKWGGAGCERWLLSTCPQLAKLAGQAAEPLKGFSNNLFVLEAPDEMPGSPAPAGMERDEFSGDEEESENRGLHAKIVAARASSKWVAWIGSANATLRGWTKNCEIQALMHLGDKEMRGLLNMFETLAAKVRVDALPAEDETNTDEDIIEEARKALVADWELRQVRRPGILLLKADTPPPIDLTRLSLRVGTMAGVLQNWRAGQTEAIMPIQTDGVESELIRFALVLGNLESCWIQRIPLDPPPDSERDRRAIAAYLDPRTFLAWIRELLNGYRLDDGGGAWDGQGAEVHAGRQRAYVRSESEFPSLEEILKAWSKNPDTLLEADRKMRDYFGLLRKNSMSEESKGDIEPLLIEFEKVWDLMRTTLLKGGGA